LSLEISALSVLRVILETFFSVSIPWGANPTIKHLVNVISETVMIGEYICMFLEQAVFVLQRSAFATFIKFHQWTGFRRTHSNRVETSATDCSAYNMADSAGHVRTESKSRLLTAQLTTWLIPQNTFEQSRNIGFGVTGQCQCYCRNGRTFDGAV